MTENAGPAAPVTPRWSLPTKFLVALSVLAMTGALLARFAYLLGPVILAGILAYLLNPVAAWLSRKLRLRWGRAVALVYLVLVIVLIGALTAIGVVVQQQVAGLYGTVEAIVADLPAFVGRYFGQAFTIGPFTVDPTSPDLQPLYAQLTGALQPAISQAGSLAGRLASSTIAIVGWLSFVLVVSFYMLHDLPRAMPFIEAGVPEGYQYDARRLVSELGPIWNAFLRGQVTLALGMGVFVGIAMAALGVRYAPGLGLLAFGMEFVPIVGPTISALTSMLVALFQENNWLGINQVYFALVVLAAHVILQQVQNSIFVPRIMGRNLRLHPIVILVGVLVMAQLVGFAGLLLSAPLVATLRLFGAYAHRKVLDLDPWPEPPAGSKSKPRVG